MDFIENLLIPSQEIKTVTPSEAHLLVNIKFILILSLRST